jgi:transcription factor CP2-like protein
MPLQLGAVVNPMMKEGYTYTLDSPTSGLVRRGEDPLTYLNKDQFYQLTLEFHPSANTKQYYPVGNVSSMIMLQFREKKEPEEAMANWEFWQTRQHSPKLRLIDVDPKGCTGVIGQPNEIAHNAVVICWNPSDSPVVVNVAVRCLSTDFSSQKGVKGIPLHVQVECVKSATCTLAEFRPCRSTRTRTAEATSSATEVFARSRPSATRGPSARPGKRRSG